MYLQKLMKSFKGQLDGGIVDGVEGVRRRVEGGKEEETGIKIILGIVK